MQELIVYLIVAGAFFYLAKMLWGAATGKKTGCGSCSSNCASKSVKGAAQSTPASVASPLIQIEMTNMNGHHKK